VTPARPTTSAPGREPLSLDARKVLLAQALRALVYGFGSVHLGIVLESRGWSTVRIGVLLTAVVAGLALMTVLVGRYGDRLGRRRCYTALFVALAAVGVALASTGQIALLIPVVLTGALSTEVVESGPFTSLEQSMLASEFQHHRLAAGFSIYNATATLAGSVGALLAGGPKLLQGLLPGPPSDPRLFLVFVPVALLGALVARSLSSHIEAEHGLAAPPRSSLQRSRATVTRLSFLFAIDAFAGGFVIQTLVVVFLSREFDASSEQLGLLFFGIGLIQTASFLTAPFIARRIGLLATMVVTHIPSNLCLIALPFAPNLGVAIGLLLVRAMLGQMDVPTRQAYVMALVDPDERTAAAAYTGTARYIARPLAPLINVPIQAIAPGAGFVVAGTLKCGYDLVLWRWFRKVPLPEEELPRAAAR
jgi:MFS family permease